jgi:hypothetical protein
MTKRSRCTHHHLASYFCSGRLAGLSRWTAASDVEISTHGYIAMGLGVFFSLLVGCGLMALVFYSSRRGYDDLPQAKIQPSDKDIASNENEGG